MATASFVDGQAVTVAQIGASVQESAANANIRILLGAVERKIRKRTR